MAEIMAVNETDFEEKVIREQLPVLVDFWAPWCAPCKMIAPVLDDLAATYQGRLKILKVNVDENPQLAGQYQVMGIPAMLLFKGGALVDSFVGVMPKQTLVGKIEPHL
ncbi:MAG: thioredoxin [Firmicutes bacterium]|nr:thioredoxin [Bacillota bacterium]